MAVTVLVAEQTPDDGDDAANENHDERDEGAVEKGHGNTSVRSGGC
jgi:hypothetical protein